MSTHIIDAFLVTFGIDARGYHSGEREVRKSLKGTREEAKSTFDDFERRGKNAGQAFRSLRNEVAGLILVFAGARSITEFASNILTSEANASRLGETLGMSTSRVVAWENVLGDVGGTAGEADAALQSMQKTISNWKLTGQADPGLLAFGISARDLERNDPEFLLMKLAQGRSKMNPQEFASRLQMLGIPQNVIFLMEKGTKALQEQLAAAEKNANVTERDAEAAKRFQQQLNELGKTIQGQVRPYLTWLVEKALEFLKTNDLINVAMPAMIGFVGALGVAALAAYGPFFLLAGAIALVAANIDKMKAAWDRYNSRYDDVSEGSDGFFDPIRKMFGLKSGAEARRDNTDIFGTPLPGGAPAKPTNKAPAKPAAGQSTEDFLRQHGWAVEGNGALTGGGLRDLAEAAITGIGGHITSRTRTYEQQKRLYDAYTAYRGGRGPWAPLAAKPGHSAHETGSALDIAYGRGISLSTIAAALLARHIPFNDLRNEGNHFHVALGARAAAAKANRGGSSSTTHIGTIVVQTKATDANGIARDIGGELKRRGVVVQSDTGLAS